MSTELNLKAERAAFRQARGTPEGVMLSANEEMIFIGWCLARRASPAAAVPEGALPPLPACQDRVAIHTPICADFPQQTKEGDAEAWDAYYTAQQMREYARAAVEADRAQNAGARIDPKAAETRMDTGFDGGAGMADRAQQGEPVGELSLPLPSIVDGPREYWSAEKVEVIVRKAREYQRKVDEKIIAHQDAELCRLRAATKAAAPDDAPTEELRAALMELTATQRKLIDANAELNMYRLAAPVPDTGIPAVERAARALIAAFDDPSCHIASLNNYVRDLESALSGRAPVSSTPTSAAVEGWKLVPVEPTPEMIAAMQFRGDIDIAIGHAQFYMDAEKDYAAMLAAAPSHPSEAKAGEASNG